MPCSGHGMVPPDRTASTTGRPVHCTASSADKGAHSAQRTGSTFLLRRPQIHAPSMIGSHMVRHCCSLKPNASKTTKWRPDDGSLGHPPLAPPPLLCLSTPRLTKWRQRSINFAHGVHAAFAALLLARTPPTHRHNECVTQPQWGLLDTAEAGSTGPVVVVIGSVSPATQFYRQRRGRPGQCTFER